MRTLVFKTTAVSAAVLMGLVSTAALSQSHQEEHTYFGGRFSLVKPDSDRFITLGGDSFSYDSGFSSLAFGLQLGHKFGNGWELRTYYDRLRTDVDGASSDDGHMYGVDGIYNFSNGIYAGLGFNQTEFHIESDTFARGTLGYMIPINDRWAFRTEYNIQNDGDFTDHLIGASINYAFGIESSRTEPRSAPQPDPQTEQRTTDSDNDGVPDSRDNCADTPRTHVVDDEGCTVYVEQNVRHELVVNFEFDSAEVRQPFYNDIEDLADVMKEHDDVSIEIGGHTDLIGPRDYNQDLSERRAQAVKQVLVERYNIDADRISTRGYGMSRPVIDEVSLDANPVNRRIEATLSATEEVALTKEMQRRGY